MNIKKLGLTAIVVAGLLGVSATSGVVLGAESTNGDLETELVSKNTIVFENQGETEGLSTVMIDYSGYENWNEDTSIVLQGRSFGGDFYYKKSYDKVDFEGVPSGKYELWILDGNDVDYFREVIVGNNSIVKVDLGEGKIMSEVKETSFKECVISVYSADGELLETYSGSFNIENSGDFVKVIGDNGECHSIYGKSAIIVVDEK